MMTNKKCSSIKTVIASIIKTIYRDVNNEISFNCCSNETKKFLEEIFDSEKEKANNFSQKS